MVTFTRGEAGPISDRVGPVYNVFTTVELKTSIDRNHRIEVRAGLEFRL